MKIPLLAALLLLIALVVVFLVQYSGTSGVQPYNTERQNAPDEPQPPAENVPHEPNEARTVEIEPDPIQPEAPRKRIARDRWLLEVARQTEEESPGLDYPPELEESLRALGYLD